MMGYLGLAAAALLAGVFGGALGSMLRQCYRRWKLVRRMRK